MADSLKAVREAAIDGRMQNVIYRQIQLEKLQEALVNNAKSIKTAIVSSNGHTDVEATTEYLLTLLSLKNIYQSLDSAETLKNEYSISRGEDYAMSREGVGIVYIVPTTYTLFYSVIVTISSALAAGNCVVLELENTLHELPSLLRKLLKSSLDPSIIGFTSSYATDNDLGPHHIRVFQTPAKVAPPTSNAIISSSLAGTVVVVDRSANLAKAADALVVAKSSFGGNSPYAPGIVLVNEFVKNAFLAALVEASLKFTTKTDAVDAKPKANIDNLLRTGNKTNEVNIIASSGKVTILDVKKRDEKLFENKSLGCTLVVHSVRSLDDAIDFANRNGTLLASYIFADNKSAKYLSQFITSHVSFVNQVPVEMLVGPPTPANVVVDRFVRYPMWLFSVPRPKYVTYPPSSRVLHESLRDDNVVQIAESLFELSRELKPKNKRSEGGQIGFFEQGILTGVGLSLLTLFGMGGLCYYGTFWVLKYGSRV